MCGKYHLRHWSKDEQEFRSKHSRQVWNKRSSVVDAKVVCDWGIVASLDADRKLKIEKVFKFDVFTSIRRFSTPFRRFCLHHSTFFSNVSTLFLLAPSRSFFSIKFDGFCSPHIDVFPPEFDFLPILLRRIVVPHFGVFPKLFRCFPGP